PKTARLAGRGRVRDQRQGERDRAGGNGDEDRELDEPADHRGGGVERADFGRRRRYLTCAELCPGERALPRELGLRGERELAELGRDKDELRRDRFHRHYPSSRSSSS